MADIDWKKILQNTKFEDLDKNLAGVPSILATRYDPARYQARSATPVAPRNPNGLVERIASGLSGVVKGGTFGLFDPIMNAESKLLNRSKEWENIKSARDANPKERDIGEVAGTIGSAFANPAAAASGVGALRAALPGARLLPTVARNAIQTSTTAIPQAAGELAQGEGLGKVAGGLAGNMAAGTVLGSATEGIIRKLPGILKQLKKVATATAVREGLDIDPRSFRNAATMRGKLGMGSATRQRAEDLGGQLVDMMNKEGITDEASREAWIAAQKARWKDVDAAFDQSKAKPSDFMDKIAENPTVKDFLAEHGEEGAARLKDLMDKADQKSGIGDIRDFLQKRIDYWRKTPKDLIDADSADVAKAVRDTIDGAFVPPELKADYAKYKAIDEALTREDLRMPKTFGAGSQTAGRMIGSGLAGGVLGGVSGVNPEDPESLKKALARSAIGFAAGSLAPRAGAAIANKLTGRLAAKVAPLIPELAERTGEVAGGAAARLGGRAIGAGDAGQPTAAKVDAAEQAAAPEAVEAAKAQTNSVWGDAVVSRLDALYEAYIAPQYADQMSRDQFIEEVRKQTNDFDPKLTAGAVFQNPDEKERYLRSYEAALRLQGYQKEYQGRGEDFISEAINPRKAPLGISIPTAEQRGALDTLKGWATSLMTEQGKAPAKATIDQVSKDLDTIVGMRIPAERKRQLIVDHLANYGLDVSGLMKYGQIGGLAG